ncbi:hypothetical protein HMPREF1624_01157 [Sporothrix schenckii ATCC 58251]|uniref:Urease accessory protein UreD n=1 Tax=Sporothrix schenckii (strain ATCC 58251 / de Perez 2211183) TaxID=1391915 RepID=U7Q4N4_SPOS1|nr:hypothetical protein HMPREF1624_01157 [Sporothrix schenckii ATCC 58251]
MISPFPPSTATPGDGRIVATLTPNGEPSLGTVSYQYPLKLIAPATGAGVGTLGRVGAPAATAANKDGHETDPARRRSSLVFMLSYGGGLVAGDQVNLRIEVQAGSRLSLVTQGTTKVFKATGAGRAAPVAVPTRQNLTVDVAPGAGLCLLPDPVQPFAESLYEQVQVVRLDERGVDGVDKTAPSLCLLDWVTQGRAARGENWSFTSWKGRNEVWLATGDAVRDDSGGRTAAADTKPIPHRNRLLVRDAVMLAHVYLDSGVAPLPPSTGTEGTALRDSLQGLAVVGTLILRGPLVDAAGVFFLAEFAALPRLGARDFRDTNTPEPTADKMSLDAWRAERLRLEAAHGVLWSAAAVRGCVVVKFGARSVEGGRLWVGAMLQREGSVAAAFGEEALMCVK